MRSINIKFPLVDDSSTNSYFKMNKTTKEAFSSNLLLLLLTEKGERYYMPDYGTNLLKYVFDPGDNITANEIVQDLKRSVELYIPNLSISDVEFNWFDENDEMVENTGNKLNVKIKFTYSEDAFTESGVLDINF